MTRTRITLLTAMIAATALSFAGATGTAANSSISNTGTFTYVDDNGTPQTVNSTPVTITVAQVAGVNIAVDGTVATPGQTVYGAPGSTVYLTYTVTNTGNGSDTVNLTTQNGAGAALSGVTYFYDTALTQPVTGNAVSLAADQSKTVYAAYTVPGNAVGGAGVYITPVGTSAFNTAVVDSNNVGLISPTKVHTVTVSTDNSVTATTPGSVTGAHTLKNTGNTPIASGDVTLVGTVNDTNAILATVSYTVSSGASSGAASANATTALNNYLTSVGPLAAGQSVTVTTTYTTAAGKTIGQTATDALKGYFVQASTASDTYGTTASNATTGTDTLTLVGGIANVTKTADNCGTDVTCATPTLNTTTGKPGDYIRYTIKVANSGSSALKKPIIQDTLNTNLLYVKATSTFSQTGAGIQAVYSSDNTTYTATAPTTLTSGGTLYVGLNTTGGSVKPTSADTLNAGANFTVVIVTQIK
ncbi:hypothetical protein Q0M94_17030 (plasmid) [Deinococcus radiomollis]|uniref:hypothetical protein n=1 Tax=Deinococcus radiomollis TaxID=468916 RepID=UPI003892B557